MDRAEPRSAISEGNICARDLTHWKQIDLQHLDVRDPTMSCWETFQELEVGQRNKILLELQEIYGGSFEFDATIYLMQWLEQQAWEDAMKSNIEGTNIIKAKQLMDDVIVQLNEQKKKLENFASIAVSDIHNVLMAKKIQEVIQQLEAKYGNDPVKLYEYFYGVVIKLRELVQLATNIPDGMTTLDSDDMEMEESVPPDPHAELRKQLEELVKDSQKHDVLLKEIEQLKEQYVIKFQEVTARIAHMEAQKNQITNMSNMNEKDKKQRLEKLKVESEKLQQQLSRLGEELSIAKRLGFIECLCNHLKKLSEIEKSIFEEIAEWKHLQQRSLCGYPCPPPLDKLQEICETLAELLWKLFQQASQLDNLFHQAFQGNEVELKRMENVKTSARNLLQWFLIKTFIIERQPPQVLKKETKFGTVVRHLLGDKLNIPINPPEVSVSLISEKQAQSLHSGGRNKSNGTPSSNPVLNSKKTLEFNQVTRKLVAEFKNLSLTKATRQGGKNKEAVTEEKSALYFTSQITLGKEQFNIFVMSVPVVVTVHGNQQCDAEATVFWENAFSEKERKPFDVPDQIEWPRFSDALNKRWTLSNGRELGLDCITYLGAKLFPGKLEGGMDSALVTKQMLNRDHINGRTFSFWKWFYGALDVVCKRLVDEWRDGHVAGFVSKVDAHKVLESCTPGTFMLRFSDSELGGVSVAYVQLMENGPCEVVDVEPWTNTHLQMRKFSDRLKDLDELIFLYPSIQKHVAFGSYYTNDDNIAAEGSSGYHPTVLATRLAGHMVGRSPMHPGSQDSTMETLSSSSFPISGFSDMSLGLYPGSPASPASPQSVVSSVLETELGLGNQEIVGDFGHLAPDLALSSVFLSGLNQGADGVSPGPASYLSAMAAAMGDDPSFAEFLLSDDLNTTQP